MEKIVNEVTIKRPTVKVKFSEYKTEDFCTITDVVHASIDAILGLGYSLELVKDAFDTALAEFETDKVKLSFPREKEPHPLETLKKIREEKDFMGIYPKETK